jgi:hypothetical protein
MCADPKIEEDNVLINASDVVTELNGYDVLLGRSVPKWKCSGNGIFRKLIANHGDEYRSLNKHAYKDEIARRIFLTIRVLGGRFLRQIEPLIARERLNIDRDTEAWVAVDDETSLQKIKQALRDLPYNSKSSSAPTLVKENCETAPKMFAIEERMSVYDDELSRYVASIALGANCRGLGIGHDSRFAFRKRQSTKLEDILAHRKKEYMKVHNLAISTQLCLLKQHQGQRIGQAMKRKRYQSPLRGSMAPGDSSKLTTACVKKFYAR